MTLTCFPLAVSAGALMNRMFVVSVPEILLTIFSTQIFIFILFFLTETVVLLEDISHSFARDSLHIHLLFMYGGTQQNLWVTEKRKSSSTAPRSDFLSLQLYTLPTKTTITKIHLRP